MQVCCMKVHMRCTTTGTYFVLQSYSVPLSVDNLSVDDSTGDIWISVLHQPLNAYRHYENFR